MKRIVLQLLTALATFSATSSALAQNFTITSISSADLGTVVAPSSGQTVFRAVASSGSVTAVSGSAVRKSVNAVRSLVTIACGNPANCANGNAAVLVTFTGTPTGRAGALTNFTVSTSGATATIAVAPATGNTISFELNPVGQNATKTFWLGYDIPIGADNTAGATGAAGTSFAVTVSRTGGQAATSLSSTVSATVLRSISIAKTADLAFGRIAAPKSGTATVSLAAGNGAVTLAGGARKVSSVASTAAAFAVSGEGGQAVTVSVPSTITMSGPGGNITVNTTATGSGSQVLSGSIGSAGTLAPKVGGSFNLPSTLTPGNYAGTIAVTVQYN